MAQPIKQNFSAASLREGIKIKMLGVLLRAPGLCKVWAWSRKLVERKFFARDEFFSDGGSKNEINSNFTFSVSDYLVSCPN